MFEHQVPNKEVGPPFRGRLVPHGTLPSKFWTVSNWMFTLLFEEGKLWGMKGVEIHFALCTPGRSIKAQCCSDLLIEEVMGAIWRPPDDHLWMRLSVRRLTVFSWNMETCLGNGPGTAGSRWSSPWPHASMLLHNRAERHNNVCEIAGCWMRHLTFPVMSCYYCLFTVIYRIYFVNPARIKPVREWSRLHRLSLKNTSCTVFVWLVLYDLNFPNRKWLSGTNNIH